MAKKQPSTAKADQSSLVSENTKLSLTVPWETFSQAYDTVLHRSAKQVKVKGFRKGKAPKKIAEESLSKEQLIDKALQDVIPPLYQQLIEKEGKQPLTNPEFNPTAMEWGKDWMFEVFIAEKPEVKLGDYKKVIKTANKNATEEIKKIEKEHEEIHKTEEHHHTEEELNARDREVRLHHIFRELIQSIKLQIPELLLKEETRRSLNELVRELESMKLTLDNYLQRKGQSFEDLSQELAAQTLGQLQLGFILDSLERAEKIEVLDADREKELAAVKDEKLRKHMQENPRYRDYLESQIRRRKLLDLMISM